MGNQNGLSQGFDYGFRPGNFERNFLEKNFLLAQNLDFFATEIF